MNQADLDFRELDELKTTRVNFEWHWQRISDYVIPRRSDFTVTRYPGQRRDYNVYDSTAPWALDQLAAGLHSLLTSQALPWFYLKVRNPEINKRTEVQVWLDDTRQRINDVFNDPQSRFQSQVHELYLDLGAFGTAVMFVEQEDGVKFSTRFLGECYIKQSQYGIVDTCYRVFTLTRDQAEGYFGDDTPIKIRENTDPNKVFDFVHVVKPDGRRWSSRYYWIDGRALVKEGSYDSFPYIVPRWSKSVMEDYGRSPAMTCLSDILMVNEMSRTILRAAHKAVDPPLLAPDGGYIQAINLTPGHINYYDASTTGEIKFLESKSKFEIGQEQLKSRQEAIVRAFYVDMLQLPGGLMPGAQNQNTYMTATEANIRRENTMRVLGPITSRLQNELLNPLITRVFSILKKQRALAPAPALMHGESLDIEYVSPLAMSQRGAEGDSWIRLLQLMTPVAQIDPTVYQSVNFDELLRWGAEIYHTPQRLLYSPGQVQHMRDQQAAQQQSEIQDNQNEQAMRRNLSNAQSISKVIGAMKA